MRAVNNVYACSGTRDIQDTGCKEDNGGGGLDQNMEEGGRDLSRIWEETKSPGKATWTVSTTMRFDTLHIFATKEQNSDCSCGTSELYICVDCGACCGVIRRDPLGGRGKKIYLLFPKGLTKGSWSVDAPRVVLPQGPTDLDNPRTLCQREGSRPGGAAGISIETQPFPCFKEMENWLGGTIIAGFHLP